MIRRKKLLSVVSVIAGCAGAKPGFAGPITFAFAGEVTHIIDPNDLLEGAVTLGTEFSGSYTFESATPDTVSSPATGAFGGSVSVVAGLVGGIPFSGPITSNGSIYVVDDGGSLRIDQYTLSARVSFFSESLSLGILLRDDTGTAFLTDALPLTAPDLHAFQTTTFSIANEVIPLFIDGNITSLVPEPASLVFLALGLGAFAARWRIRHTKLSPISHSTQSRPEGTAFLTCALASSLFIVAPREAYATDCNGNSIDDEVELAHCPAIDLVFLIDTSGSMELQLPDLCDAIDHANPLVTNDVVSALALGGLTVNHEILVIGPDGATCDCCASEETVGDRYGFTAEGFSPALGGCGGCEQGDCEDWGTATGIVAANKPWGPGPRIIVPISDEGPACGSWEDRPPIDDPGPDRDVIEAAIPILAAQRVIVGPVIDKSVPGLESLAQDLADINDIAVNLSDLALTKPECAGSAARVNFISHLSLTRGEAR